ncbi:ASCH/PUA domain-containing protein [Chloroflexota bacterium]
MEKHNTHYLKVWPEYFEAMTTGKKKFEVRWGDDRQFKVGDILTLQEWDPKTERHTGQVIFRTVTYILRGPEFGIPEGLQIMSLGYPNFV